VTKVNDLYFFKPGSDKGASLIQKYGKGKEASSEEESLLKKAYEEREKNFLQKIEDGIKMNYRRCCGRATIARFGRRLRKSASPVVLVIWCVLPVIVLM